MDHRGSLAARQEVVFTSHNVLLAGNVVLHRGYAQNQQEQERVLQSGSRHETIAIHWHLSGGLGEEQDKRTTGTLPHVHASNG